MTTNTQSPSVVVIGYGTAAINGIIALRSSGYAGTITVLSAHDTAPVSPIMTSYYAGGTKTLEECFPWSNTALEHLNIQVVKKAPATKLDIANHVVNTSQGSFAYDKCLIASGSTPVLTGFDTEGASRPLTFSTLAEAQRVKATLENPACQHVLVSGTSMVAMKMVEAALNQGKKVTLAGRSEHILRATALPQVAQRFEDLLADKGVELQLGNPVTAAKMDGDVWKATFADGSTDVFDAVAIAHGMAPNLGFVCPGSLDVDKGLLVDEFMRTSDPDVYAAGDVAQAYEPTSGVKRIVATWKNAAVQGACAGEAIAADLAGAEPCQANPGFIPNNTVSVCDTLFISGGSIAMTPERHAEVTEEDGVLVGCVYEGDCLTGFSLAADADEPGGLAYDIGAMLLLRIQGALQ